MIGKIGARIRDEQTIILMDKVILLTRLDSSCRVIAATCLSWGGRVDDKVT